MQAGGRLPLQEALPPLPTRFRAQSSVYELNPNLSILSSGRDSAAVWLPTKLACVAVQTAAGGPAAAATKGSKKKGKSEPDAADAKAIAAAAAAGAGAAPAASATVLLRNEGCGVRLHSLDGSGLDVRTKIDASTYQPVRAADCCRVCTADCCSAQPLATTRPPPTLAHFCGLSCVRRGAAGCLW